MQIRSFLRSTGTIFHHLIAVSKQHTLPVRLLLAVFFLFIPLNTAHSQFFRPYISRYQEASDRLPSNNITDIVINGGAVWFGTGRGLGMTADAGNSFTDFVNSPGISRGGISAVTLHDGSIWIATAIDTAAAGNIELAGSGISWSDDNGMTWTHINQPVDPNNPDSLGYMPTTTTIQNVTFDLVHHVGAVWIASWGGGLRKSTDNGQTFSVVTPDGIPFDALNRLNHRAFSLLSSGDDLWVGTAQGVNRSSDGGDTWTNYTAQNSGISGNFVTALGKQVVPEGTIIWAATWQAEGTEEYYGVSRTTDNGQTWSTMLEGEFVHNFGFNGDEVYAVSDNGLFKSSDRGGHWGQFPWIRDQRGQQIYTTEFFSVAYGSGILWAGTADGLIKSLDGGISWSIFRSFVTPGTGGEPEVYAYPNPFSPTRDNLRGGSGHVRVQYTISSPSAVSLDIYDYGLNIVKSVVNRQMRTVSGPHAEAWDGTNNWGRMVANGVYFYKLHIDGKGAFWGKIIVMN
ncbi:hypothetical protein ACFL6I_03050 [candidate division KSB1 bacterium]